jgi:hypothetical protein
MKLTQNESGPDVGASPPRRARDEHPWIHRSSPLAPSCSRLLVALLALAELAPALGAPSLTVRERRL